MSVNQEVTSDEIRKIQDLDEFDLIMLISEIHDHGWKVARRTLTLMPEGKKACERLTRILKEKVESSIGTVDGMTMGQRAALAVAYMELQNQNRWQTLPRDFP